MDEILIGDKNYVSSKRAAQMTGYAKDYIGQLCREGRVPARLVGRSWYVLESAIQDHRFGTADIKPEKVAEPTTAWESPRYEASVEELLPSVNRPRSTDERLQDSWREWFDRVSDSTQPIIHAVTTSVPPAEQRETREEQIEKVEEIREIEVESVNVPIRAVHHHSLPPEDLLPRQFDLAVQSPNEEEIEIVEAIEPVVEGRQGSRRGVWALIRTIQVAGLLLAVSSAFVAILGTGYLDTYILTSSQARLIAGVELYDR